MNRFSSDVDILKYEPSLFDDLHLHNQVLIAGEDGTVNGTTIAANGADFNSAGIASGMVIYLQSTDGGLDGAFEIVSVDSATELTVSVLRTDSSEEAVAPPGGKM